MADGQNLDEAVQQLRDLQKRYLKRAAEVHLKPFIEHIFEGLQRCMKLVQAAGKIDDKETSGEILRSVVVLNHAYLEDFLRRVALWLIPIADEETLNKIPLVGTTGRSEKFQLGKLAAHRGKKVGAVIKESVAAYLERSTFNSVTEIMTFLESMSIKLPRLEDVESSSTEGLQFPISEKTLNLVGRDDKAASSHRPSCRQDQNFWRWVAANH